MIKALAITIILFSIMVAVPPVDATCVTTQLGNVAVTNCSDGRSGTSTTFGGATVSQFSDGTSSITNSFGNTGISNSNQPSLGGTNQSIGGTGFSQWNDGETGIHRDVGGDVRLDIYSDGTICANQAVGPTTSVTICPGDSTDAAKRSAIIGTK